MNEFVLDTELPVMAMGLPTMDVGPCSTVILTVQPQLPFKTTSIFIPRSIAIHFDIADFRVGKDSLFISSAPISAELFAWSCGHEDCEGREVDANGVLVETNPERALNVMKSCVEKYPDQPRIVRKLRCHVALPGIIITLMIINKNSSAQRFQAALLGNIPDTYHPQAVRRKDGWGPRFGEL